jgi:hypothetical protein
MNEQRTNRVLELISWLLILFGLFLFWWFWPVIEAKINL